MMQIPARPRELADALERRAAVARVMQDAVADDDLEETVLERRPEQVHLRERRAVEAVSRTLKLCASRNELRHTSMPSTLRCAIERKLVS